MKIFVFLFLAILCQANRKDEEAFTFLSNLNTEKIIQTVENEVNLLMQKKLSPNEIKMVRNMANTFVETLLYELEKAIFIVTEWGDVNHQFTIRMLENLRRAAENISKGLNMTEDMLDKFVEDLMKDLTHLEETGLLDVDLDIIFQGIAERALIPLQENTRQKRDVAVIFDPINDTLSRIIGTMTGKFQDQQDFFEAHMKLSVDKMKPHFENMKILAQNFITNIKSTQKSVLQHAIEFFAPFAEKMGKTYEKLMSKVEARLEKMNVTPITVIYK